MSHHFSVLWDSVHLEILRKQGLRGHPVFTAALLTLAGTWKPPKRPPTGEWTKQMWDIYTGQYYSAVKNEVMPFTATWMGLEIIILSEVRQRRQILHDVTYMWI